MLSVALQRYVEANGGVVLTGATVRKFIVEDNECIGFRLEDGTDITARQAVVSELDPYQTYLHGFDEGVLTEDFLDLVRNFRFGDVTIARVHYALNEAPEFKNGTDMDKTAFQRIFGTLADIDKQYNEMAMGLAPTDPFLWTAAWTTMDPTPCAGRETYADHGYLRACGPGIRRGLGTNRSRLCAQYPAQATTQLHDQYG